MAYHQVRTAKVSDAIEQQLEQLILEGILPPGEKLLPERELAKQLAVSRPSLREAILRLELKGLLVRRHGGGTFVQRNLWQSFHDPLADLLASSSESQFDLLETRHALEGIAAYYAALRGTDEDFSRLQVCYQQIEQAQAKQDLEQEIDAVIRYQIAVTEAAHNMVLLHLVRCMEDLLRQNVRQNFVQLYNKQLALNTVATHRKAIYNAILARAPAQARQASYQHLAFIEEALLAFDREQNRRERSLRRLEQRKEP